MSLNYDCNILHYFLLSVPILESSSSFAFEVILIHRQIKPIKVITNNLFHLDTLDNAYISKNNVYANLSFGHCLLLSFCILGNPRIQKKSSNHTNII